jgi:hypothetical protein
VSGEVEVGHCDLCGQRLLRAPDGDVWHPWDVLEPCPPEPPYAEDPAAWIAWWAAGNRSLRPGAAHFVPG